MDRASKEKLLKAGYVFLRTEDVCKPDGKKARIRYSKEHGVWKVLGEFDTKAARNREVQELLKKPDFLLDE